MPDGYRVELVAKGLTYPTGIAFDDAGSAYVCESGYSYGESWTQPRLVKLENGAAQTVVAGRRGTDGPWTGVAYRHGNFYIADGGEAGGGGRVLRVRPDGTMKTLVDHLPSLGDHHTNGPAIDAQGRIYFSVGTATNSGVVGPDNAEYGWLSRHPEFHDIPARDITLAGENYSSEDPLHPGSTAVTGAYVPFGTKTSPGQRIAGQIPCSGGIFRIGPDGGAPELVAWGFRNPFGICIGEDGRLYVTENSFDVRGSRPVFGTGDPLWVIDLQADLGKWYGWPDYFDGLPLDTPKRFGAPGKEKPHLLLAEPPNPPPRPAAILPVHATADGLDIAPASFGHGGEAFIAQFGDMAPTVGKVEAPVGFNVVRVDPRTGIIEPFAVNRPRKTEKYGPASLLRSGGLERPVSVRFGPDGSLYVVDFGIVEMSSKGPHPQEKTGVVWRIRREEQQ